MEKGECIGKGRTAEIFAWEQGTVLKLFRAEMPESLIADEIKVNEILKEYDLPIPKIHGITELEGRKGIIFERVDGNSMLTVLMAKPWKTLGMARLMAELHYQIHQCTIGGEPTVHTMLEKKIRWTPLLSLETKEAVVEILHKLPEGNKLYHGDLHPDNILLAKDKSVVIDWSNANIGAPAADVARTCLLLTGSPLEVTPLTSLIQMMGSAFRQAYLRNYLKLSGMTVEEVKAWELPIAAARLVEGVPEGEKKELVKMIQIKLG